jgi:predicted anti-sigma-YlaC factor YlaD
MKNYSCHRIAAGLPCRLVVDRTTDYLDGHLSTLAKVRLSLHLASCPNCRTYVKQIALVREAIALLPKAISPPPKQARLRQCFAQRHAPLQKPKGFGYAAEVLGRM